MISFGLRGLICFTLVACLMVESTLHAQDAPDTETAQVPLPAIDELLLFFPSRHPAGNWTPPDLAFQDVWFSAQDGTRVHAWYCPCDQPRATILIAHGNAGNIAQRAPWLKLLQSQLRVTTMMFDYRGYGRSDGKPSVQGVLQDARAARSKLAQLTGLKNGEIVLMGESLGGAVAVQLAAESPPRGLILQSTFTSLKNLASFHYPKLSWLVPASKLDSASQIAQVRCPLLLSHGTLDRTIPLTHGEELFRLAKEPKTLVRIFGADHNDWLTQDYLQQLDRFLGALQADR